MNNTTQKIVIIWVFSLLLRILLCFIWPNKLFLDEQGFINIDILGYNLIWKYAGYVPKFIGFTIIIAPIYYAFNFFGVRIFLALISSLGVLTVYYLMKNFTNNDNIILVSTILYNFNCLVLYYSCFIVTENLYYPIAPLIFSSFL